MYKRIAPVALTVLVMSSPGIAKTIDQCSSGIVGEVKQPYYLYGDANIASATKAKICVTTKDYRATVDIWGENGNYIDGSPLYLFGPEVENLNAKTCWLGLVTRIDFASGERDKTKKVCVRVILEEMASEPK